MQTVIINRDVVELYKILKFEGLADSGGQAKQFIEQGMVMLNGVVETQKRKKIRHGDLVEFNQQKLRISSE